MTAQLVQTILSELSNTPRLVSHVYEERYVLAWIEVRKEESSLEKGMLRLKIYGGYPEPPSGFEATDFISREDAIRAALAGQPEAGDDPAEPGNLDPSLSQSLLLYLRRWGDPRKGAPHGPLSAKHKKYPYPSCFQLWPHFLRSAGGELSIEYHCPRRVIQALREPSPAGFEQLVDYCLWWFASAAAKAIQQSPLPLSWTLTAFDAPLFDATAARPADKGSTPVSA